MLSTWEVNVQDRWWRHTLFARRGKASVLARQKPKAESLKGLLMWPCRIMKDVTGSAHFSLVIWLTPRGLQEIYYILHFPADFKAQTMFRKVAWLFHHVLPCGPSWYFLRSQFFCQQGKAGVFFITLFNFSVMATCVAWCIFHYREGESRYNSKYKPK